MHNYLHTISINYHYYNILQKLVARVTLILFCHCEISSDVGFSGTLTMIVVGAALGFIVVVCLVVLTSYRRCCRSKSTASSPADSTLRVASDLPQLLAFWAINGEARGGGGPRRIAMTPRAGGEEEETIQSR